MVEVVTNESVHKYLGRHISGDLKRRHVAELNHRISLAWGSFHKHRRVLTNKNVSISLRLKLFDAVVSSTFLFALHTLPLTGSQLQKLDTVQRRMFRSMVGWVRIDDESWRDTMSRMKTRVNAALGIRPVGKNWTRQLARKPHHFVVQMLQTPNWASAVDA